MPVIKIHGMIDPHTHLRDLDWSHKSTFASETKAAIAGGYWAVFDMPNTAPSTITAELLNQKLAKIDQTAYCDWGLYFGASQTDNTDEYAQVINQVCGLKIYNNSTTGDLLIDNQTDRDKHYAAWSGDKIIAVHAEDETVRDILALVRKYNRKTHFLHISTQLEIELLTQAKEEGLPVTVGVCPHHLFLTEDDVSTLGAYGRMKPELKTQADQNALWSAIDNGVVDIIESDHAPHTIAEKDSDKPPYGVPGLETNLPLMLQAVKDGRLSLERATDMMSTNVQRIWNITVPDDTYTVVDTDASYVIERQNLHSHCGWSPFEGMTVSGKVQEVWIRGQKVYDGEQILSQAGFGNNVFGTAQ
jgi:carbamoyl-phosphate synthase/aspartate carbamoyltransferase/dihydroorotase